MTRKAALTDRVAAAWRVGGIGRVCSSIVARLLEIRPVLLLSLAVGVAPPDTDGCEAEFAWVGHDDFDRWLARAEFQFPPREAARARAWLGRGERCLVGLVSGRPATYLWLSTSSRSFPGHSCPLAPMTAYVYKTFTLPEFRGRGLNKAALGAAQRWCAGAGMTRILIDVAPTNAASLRAIRAAGFTDLARFVIIRVGPWRRAFLPRSVLRHISGDPADA